MTCPKCGSENVDVQLFQETKGKTTKTKTKTRAVTQRGHGCLWWLFIGWWWWLIDLFIWCVAFIPRLVIQLLKGRKGRTRSTTRTISKEKVHTTYRSMCVCRECGHHWES